MSTTIGPEDMTEPGGGGGGGGGEMSMMGPEEDMDPMIAEAKRFMENYYRTFDANREGLVNLYRERSVLTFDSRKIQGKEAILAKLTSFPQCHHEIAYFKCAPDRSAPAPVGVFVRVHGGTWLGGTKDESDAAIIHQTFHLMPAPQGSFYIARLYGMLLDLKKPQTRLAGSPASRLKLLPSASPVFRLKLLPSASPVSSLLLQMLISAPPMSAASASPSTSTPSTSTPPISASAFRKYDLKTEMSMMKLAWSL